jgi:succinoglycan biosynthesis protein ExoA
MLIETANFPFITIIMPIYNEAQFIQRSLEAVVIQNYPLEHFEIIVANGVSNDGTLDIIGDYQKRYLNLSLVVNAQKIVPTGMNAALRLAHGDIIIRVDGHCVIAVDYVQKCVEHIEREKVDGVGGPMVSIGETMMGETIAAAMCSKFGVGDSYFRTERGQTKLVDSVPFPAYTREIIQKAGLYDEELVRNQDDEYNYRIRELGGKILLAADVQSKYYSRGNLKDLWKQYFQYGYWKVRVMQKHPRQMRMRQLVPPAFVDSLLVSGIIALVHPVGVWLLSGIVGLYVLANLGASIYTCAKKGWRHLPLLPVVYAILHISYGTGFLVGLVKFANRWGDKVGKTPAL